MDLQTTTHDTFDVITVDAPRIDASVAIQFKDAIRAITDVGADHVILDLGNVMFVDSSGLGAIVAAMKQMGTQRRLDLAALTPNVEKVFRLTRMDTVFVIHRDVADAKIRAAG